MYGMKPIINQIVGQLHTEYENGVMKAVQSYGFDVDKDRLAQALSHAEKFYMEGYNDAMTNHDLVEVVRCKDCKHRVKGFSDSEYVCGNPYYGMASGVDLEEDDFCSYGERRVDHA